ncbi:MAG: type protein [Fibrobacteres bacterium]|nr:type protein [Fibrobacterota bacterium]
MKRIWGKMRNYPFIVLAVCGVSINLSSAGLDTFGITQKYPTKAGTREWNSAHWANSTARKLAYDGDAFDPTGWSDNHSSGDDNLSIDGKGSMLFKGEGPRFHINSTSQYSGSGPAQKVPPQSFVNVEATGYYRRLATGGAAYDGAEIQVRTGPLAHGSSGGNVCDATGYAARFRDDGNWDFEKELKHPGSGIYSTKSGSGAPLFGIKTIPLNRWIGMKFLVYNLEDGAQVRLELYIDSVSDVSTAAPVDGGHWSLVGAVTDDGTNFPSGDISGCPTLTSKMAITSGHGTVLLRTDNESCEWKMVSVREIVAGSTTRILSRLRPGWTPGNFLLPGYDALGRKEPWGLAP